MAVSEEPSMQVFVVSDGTGDTGSATVRAAMLQFQSPWRLRVFGEVRRPPEAKRAIARYVDARLKGEGRSARIGAAASASS